MKRALKITAITFSTIIAVLAIAIIIICNIVFSPKTLTPIVRNNVGRFITCQANLDTAELTFFSTFPNFAVNLTKVELINPINNTTNDTLAYIGKLVASVNISEFLFNGNLIINQIHLNNASANIFCDIITLTSNEEEEDTTSTSLFDLLQVNDVAISNLSASYIDQKSGIDARINNLSANIDAQLQGANGNINAQCTMHNAQCIIDNIQCAIDNAQLTTSGELRDNHFDGKLAITLPSTTFDLDGNRLLDSVALHANVPAELNLDIMHINLKEALLAVNSHEINLNGVAQLENNDVNLDVQFATNQWNLEDIIALIPTAYSDLLNGIEVSGLASISGSARGTYNDSIMPLISANLNYTEGKAAYSAIPYKLHDVNASLSANIDLNDGGISNATIQSLKAHTGSMWLAANGSINDILGNMACNLNITGNLNLPELQPIIPDDIKIDMNGRANADISARFSLDDVTNLRLDKIIADATIKYNNLDVLYNDSIAIKDPKGTLTIKLPSPNINKHFKELAQASLNSTNLQANIRATESNTQYSILNSQLAIGVGDILDTTQFYTAICQFKFDHLQG